MHSNLEQETMVRIRHSAIWSLLYISLYGVLTIASCFLLSEQTLATIGIAGMHTVSDSIYAYVGASCLIFLGTAIQYALIVQLAKRPNYKGFPGTGFPFLCILAEYLLLGC